MPVHIKQLRNRYGRSAAELARELGIPQTELTQYERGWQPPPPNVVQDLAVLFECCVADILGDAVPVEEWQESPYAAGGDNQEDLDPYGDFGFRVGTKEFTFPVSVDQRDALERWFRKRGPGSDDEAKEWLTVGTLNNRILFINPSKIRRAWLRSDDDEAISYFAHPEVYRAVDEYTEEELGCGPVLRKAVEKHYEAIGQEVAEAEVSRMTLYGPDGETLDEELYIFNDEVLTGLMALDGNSFSIEPDTFLLIDSTRYHVAEYVNLSELAFIEVPRERYLRLGAPEELHKPQQRAANDLIDAD